MKNLSLTFKRWDVIIIFVIILLSFSPIGVFTYHQRGILEGNSQYIAVISVDNEIVKKVTLTGHSGIDVFDIPISEGDTKTVEIRDDQIKILRSSCPDQICVRTGYISKPGETIVCLPDKVIIEIQTLNGPTEEIFISY